MAEQTGTNILRATDGLSAIVIAVYLAAVIYQGNFNRLVNEAMNDSQYLEWMMALLALWLFMKNTNSEVSHVATMLVIGAVLAVILKAANRTDFDGAMTKFARGETGIFGTIRALFGG